MPKEASVRTLPDKLSEKPAAVVNSARDAVGFNSGCSADADAKGAVQTHTAEMTAGDKKDG